MPRKKEETVEPYEVMGQLDTINDTINAIERVRERLISVDRYQSDILTPRERAHINKACVATGQMWDRLNKQRLNLRYRMEMLMVEGAKKK